MNNIAVLTLKALRKIYHLNSSERINSKPKIILNPNKASVLVKSYLSDEKPCMIARFGANELSILINYLGVKGNKRDALSYIRGENPAWWWEKDKVSSMHIGAGFFPPKINKIEQYCHLFLDDIKQVDILGSWLSEERYVENKLKGVKKVQLLTLDPYWADQPWTHVLAGKNVLIIHPFADTIKKQYKKRKLLFKDNSLLPEFKLKTIKAVQSIAGNKTGFSDWFEALDHMKRQMDKTDYDICIIGAGAYGFSLAAHAKRSGKKGFHIGGSLQLLFGIRGERWEGEHYRVNYFDGEKKVLFDYPGLVNEHWVRASKTERPENAESVEGGCYW